MKTIGQITLTIIFMIISAIFGGWIFLKLWGWFILPVFENMPELSLIQAIGLSFVIRFFTADLKPDTDTDPDEVWGKIVYGFFYGLIIYVTILGTGWVISWFL